MPRYYITRLAIEGFRGVNNEGNPLDLRFRPDAVNSVFAVNGIGKSSIFEALTYAIHGSIPKLQKLQLQERPQEYYCNRFHSKNSATISLEFQPDDGGPLVDIHIRRDQNGERSVTSTSHADPDGFLSELREAFALLDYGTFARFIEESPLERGRTFSTLLGLAEYSDCRQALETASESRAISTDFDIKSISASVQTIRVAAQRALDSMKLSYEQVTGETIADVESIDSCVSKLMKTLGSVELLRPYCAGKTLNEVDFDEIGSVVTAAEEGEKRRQLEKTIATVTNLESLAAHDQDAILAEQKEIRELINDRDQLLESTRGDLFKRLYETAKDLLVTDTWDADGKCPLCDSNLTMSLAAHVSEQLGQYAIAGTRISEINDKWKASTWRSYLSICEKSDDLAIDVKEAKISVLDVKCSSGAVSMDDLVSVVEWTSVLRDNASSKLSAARDRKETLEKELPPSLVKLIRQVEYGRQFKNGLTVYRDSMLQAAKQQARLDIRERWKSFITEATVLFSDAETALSKARIREIDVEYKSYFREVMKVEDVVPDLCRADDKEDLHVQLIDFHGQQSLSARALLSESYRNALAISVFLAAAIKHSGTPRFIVLDDVTSSFDAGHQFSLMELIRTKLQQPLNTDGLQFIILSHDGLLEKYFDRHGSEGGWHHSKLQGLPPMGAILHTAHGSDRLKTTIVDFLTTGQVDQAKPLMRQYLEFKLQQIIRKVDIPVPIDFAIKDTSRMVSNCLDAITSAVELHRKAGTLVLEAQQVQDITTSHVPAIVGNWVSHYETDSGSSLSAAALNGMITLIDELSECFQYVDDSSESSVRRWYKSLSKK